MLKPPQSNDIWFAALWGAVVLSSWIGWGA